MSPALAHIDRWIHVFLPAFVAIGASFCVGCMDVLYSRAADLSEFDEFKYQPTGLIAVDPNTLTYQISQQINGDYQLQVHSQYLPEDEALLADRPLTDDEIAAMDQLFENVRLNYSFCAFDALSAVLQWDHRQWANGPACGIPPITEWVDGGEIHHWLRSLITE